MMRDKKILLGFVLIFFCLWSAQGCESLRKKFTRTKKTQGPQEQVIIVPRDYSAHPFPNDVLYKQYFVYWKSWNQELVTSLNDADSYRKIVDCVQQAEVDLKKMSTYLNDEKAKQLGIYIKQTGDLKSDIEKARSMPTSQMISLRYKAERILSSVNRQFDPHKMKDSLKNN